MAIPPYVHPFKLLLACVGIDPRRGMPKSQVFVHLLCNLGEIAPSKAGEALSQLKAGVAELGHQLETNSDVLLKLDRLTENVGTKLDGSIKTLGPGAIDDLVEACGDWLSKHLRIDEASFNSLLTYAIGNLQTLADRKRPRPPALIELDTFCEALFSINPAAFHAAYQEVFPFATSPAPPAPAHRLQAQMRPLHLLIQSSRHETNGELYSAQQHRVTAWANAAEAAIYDLIRFVWIMRGYPDSTDQDTPDKRALLKEDIFGSVAAWCDEKSIQFPFRRDLYKIKDAIVHGHYLISESEVSFSDNGGNSITSLKAEDLAEIIEHDILISSHFGAALLFAQFRHKNRTGALDAAWATAKSRIPDLDLMTLDIDAIWPNRTFLERRKNFPRRTFDLGITGDELLPAESTSTVGPIAATCGSVSVYRGLRPSLDGPLLVDLEALLHSLFGPDPDDLRIHLRRQESGAELVNALPSPSVGLEKWTHAAVLKLHADGRLDGAFFAGLATRTPRRANEIETMRRRILGEEHTPQRGADTTVTRGRVPARRKL